MYDGAPAGAAAALPKTRVLLCGMSLMGELPGNQHLIMSAEPGAFSLEKGKTRGGGTAFQTEDAPGHSNTSFYLFKIDRNIGCTESLKGTCRMACVPLKKRVGGRM
ncbi:MAG TPA: hypothetical protein H9857_00425, partial [Candidatus Desulfovibrio intestinigallinarum]|nr:hypothetical protein [Candidatus Desulfovibrio intestinigallinarum]